MRERRRLQLLVRLRDAQALRRAAAREALAIAKTEAEEREHQASKAREVAAEAHGLWCAHMRSDRLDITQMARLAASLSVSDDKADEAGRHLNEAKNKLAASQTAYAHADLRLSMISARTVRIRKTIARRLEENAMMALGDRTTYQWMAS